MAKHTAEEMEQMSFEDLKKAAAQPEVKEPEKKVEAAPVEEEPERFLARRGQMGRRLVLQVGDHVPFVELREARIQLHDAAVGRAWRGWLIAQRDQDLFDLGIAWIEHGLVQGKTALEGTARALVKTAQTLDVLREKLEDGGPVHTNAVPPNAA